MSEPQSKKGASVFKVVLSPLVAFKYLWYRWLVFVMINSFTSIYIYNAITGKNATSQTTLGLPVWAFVLILLLTLLIIGFSIAFSIATRKNVKEV